MRSIATEGGFLWRYSPDLSVRAGEDAATPTQVWVQAPGTPAVGRAFLEAWRVTQDAVHLEAARAAAQALVRGQLESGGWDYLIEFDAARRAHWRYRMDPGGTAADAGNTTVFDDNNTQGAISFLLAFLDAAKAAPAPGDAAVRESVDYALDHVIRAQYPNGAWPQRWDGRSRDVAEFPVLQASIPAEYPREHPRSGYFGHYTFNDDAHRDLVLMLLDAARRTGRADCREAALRGADFLLLSQLPEPQPGWAQQYDARMHPAWARAFEPPGVSSRESVGVIRLLIDVYVETGDEKYLAPIPPALAWLERSRLAPGRWARLYELGTNRPIYGDRDRRIHYTLAELSDERRRGYAWESGFDAQAAMAEFDELRSVGREEILRRRAQPRALSDRRAARLMPRVRAAIDALGSDGIWLTRGREALGGDGGSSWIETAVFNRNVAILCEFLEASAAR